LRRVISAYPSTALEMMREVSEKTDSTHAKRRKEAAKIEASLVRAFRIPVERGRMEKRILSHASSSPAEMVPVLLKYYSHDNARVRNGVRKLLNRLTERREGMKSVLDSIIHPNRDVRRNAVEFLREHMGMYAVTYASFYEHTALLVAMARNKDMPVEDIEDLAQVSKEDLLDGDIMDALQDIASCFDFIKHRHRAANLLKGYLTQMLRMAPELTRLGVYDERIEEPLRKALTASKNRYVDETKEIIDLRKMERSLRQQIDKIGKAVNARVEKRPSLEPAQMQGADVWVQQRLQALTQSLTTLAVAGKKREAMVQLQSFMKQDFNDFWEANKDRMERNDPSALFTLYVIGLVCLKLASMLMPQSSEDLYQKHYRIHELEPSIHIVAWPDTVMKIIS